MAENARKKPSGEAMAAMLRMGRPSAEAVARDNVSAGRQTPPDFGALGGGYDLLPAQAGAGQAPPSETGAPGMVYALDDMNEPVLMTQASAMQKGWPTLTAEEARAVGENGVQVVDMRQGGGAFTGAKAAGMPDPRMLAAMLMAGR